MRQGFTLIELSIVLVIIGLIVGGVLVGQNLISAAAVRAQITQIEKYNTAANTFRDKYGGLPGDLNAAGATQFGFTPRGAIRGEGDGNGVIEGVNGDGSNAVSGYFEDMGETIVFWADLSIARLIDAGLVNPEETYSTGYTVTSSTGTSLAQLLPAAKIGAGNYVYVWSGGINGGDGHNYYGLSIVTSIPINAPPVSGPGLTVQQAYNIDKKVDDGFPQTGSVTAMYLDFTLTYNNAVWASGGGVAGVSPGTAVSGSATTCYDDGGSTSNAMAYSLAQSNGNGVNCALSFKMQAGD